MKSLQLLLGILCLSAHIRKSLADEESNIQKIIFIEEVKADTVTMSIYFKVGTAPGGFDDCQNHTLNIIVPNGESANILSKDNSNKPDSEGMGNNKVYMIPFTLETTDYSRITMKEVKLELSSRISDSEIVEGHATVNIDENPPTVDSLVGKITAIPSSGKAGKCDLRVENVVLTDYKISGGNLKDDSTCETTEPTACYFMDVTANANTKFSVCKIVSTDADGHVKLCSEDATSVDAPEGFATGTIKVDYGSPKIQITTSSVGSTSWEMITPEEGTNPIAYKDICTDVGFTSVECALKISGDQNILLVGVATDGVKEYNKQLVKDIELAAVPLSATSAIIEVTVKKSNDFNFFQMERNPAGTGQDDAYKKAVVDCHEIEGDHCRGYFVDLINGDYVVTVKTMSDSTTVDAVFSYDSASVNIAHTQFQSFNDISIEDIQVRQVVGDKVTKFCFKYNYESINKKAQYEIILINKEGYMKRAAISTEIDEAQDCSTAIDLPRENFEENSDLKMLVIARDVNTAEVLASAEKTLSLSGI